MVAGERALPKGPSERSGGLASGEPWYVFTRDQLPELDRADRGNLVLTQFDSGRYTLVSASEVGNPPLLLKRRDWRP